MKFVDLGIQYERYKDEIREEMDRVLSSTAFINGPAVGELEEGLSAYCGAKHAVVCASGTDAILLGLMAFDVQPGDEIIIPAFTFIATASMVALYRAVPVFVDVDPVTFNMNPEEVARKISPRTRGIIPVSLYGQCPDMDSLNAIASEHNLWVMEDAAQSFGATYKGSSSCSLSDMATTSFFPAKPLGGYGDGGAVFTDRDDLAENLRILRNHGQTRRYEHSVIGLNGRMDTLQAAILKVKLRHYAEEVDLRNEAALRYHALLGGSIAPPVVLDGNSSTWAQYTVRIPNRDAVRDHLAQNGIPTAVHYPIPLGRQEAFAYLDDQDTYPVAEELASSVLSLPMHAYITPNEQAEVITALKEAMDA